MSETTEIATQGEPKGETALQPDTDAANTGTQQTATETTDPQTEPVDPDAAKAAAEAETQRRIAKSAFEAREARRQVRAAEAELATLRQATPIVPNSPEDIARRVADGVAAETRQSAFNAEANRIYADGVENIPGFTRALEGFKEIGGLNNALIEAAAEAGPAAKILHYLGQNLDEAEALNAMSPARMGAAVAKLASKVSAAPAARPVSNAPPPIKPIGGAALPVGDPEKMSMKEWQVWRSKLG